MEGSVARSGNRVRITAQLIDGASDEHIWALTYEDKVEDVLALQSRIATATAKHWSMPSAPSRSIRWRV